MSKRRRSVGSWVSLAAASLVVAVLAWWSTATLIAVTLSIVFENEQGTDPDIVWTRRLRLIVPALIAGLVAAVLAGLERGRLPIPPAVAAAVAGVATVVLGVFSLGPRPGEDVDERTWALWVWGR